MVTTQQAQFLRSLNCAPKDHGCRRTGGNCRYYKARTTLVVKRATTSVMALFEGLSIPPLTLPVVENCSSLYKAVKQYLSIEVSPEPEIQMAFQSIKKLLPDACKCMRGSMLSDLRTRLTRSPPQLDPAYLSHCKLVLSEIFTEGWDKSWNAKTRSFSPSLGSSVGSSRRDGGQLAALAVEGRDAFLESLYLPKGELRGELLLVDSSGKPRPLTRFEHSSAALRPLHGLLYDQLSKKEWLLRGDLTTEKMWEAGFREKGGALVSGDYVSASDNLPIEVAELVLDFAWSKSKFVPAAVWAYAYAAQRPNLTFEDEDHLKSEFVPTLGQMMGSYLCFPLLCLQNYLAFRWACHLSGEVNVPVLINGDDILFQEPKEGFFSHWLSKVKEVGLEVEQSKTSYSQTYGSLNSTLVRWGGGKLRVTRTFRMGMLRSPDHPSNLGASFETFAKVGRPSQWYKAGLIFMDWHAPTIVRWMASPAEMSFFGRLAKKCWKRAFGGLLWAREAYRSQVEIPSLQPAPCPHSIIMRSTEFVNVSPDRLDKQAHGKIAEWMAARKWELGRTFKRTKSRDWLKERQSQVLTVSNHYWFSSLGTLRRVVRLWSKELTEVCARQRERRALFEPPPSLLRKTVFFDKNPSRFFPGGLSYEKCGMQWGHKVNLWKRSPKSNDVRVPLPLLEELGLKVTVVTPSEIVGWCSEEKYGKGWRMLYGRSDALNGGPISSEVESQVPVIQISFH